MQLMLATNIYIVTVVIWTATFVNRSAQRQMKRASFLMGMLLLGWVVLHLLNSQLESYLLLHRHIWYSYTIFELGLPLLLLWMAYIVDKPDGKTGVPLWMRFLIVVNCINSALSLTNDFHLFVHPLDVTSPDWILEYGYGVGFYFWQAGWMLPLLSAVIIMLIKIGVYVRKRMLLFPLMFFTLLLVYQYGYINRIPLMWESDRIMVNGIFALLFVEAIIRAGLIPVNINYQALFTHSPLSVRIIDERKQTALSSAASTWYDYDTFTSALRTYPEPARFDKNTLLFAAPITGGYALWQEDITILTRLQKETADSVRKLEAANAMLAEEEEIERAAQEEIEKTQLMAQLDSEITGYTIRLSTMIEQLENAVDKPKATTRIMLLLCYIKRRCNLFFREKEDPMLPADELTVYLDELAEMAGYSGVRIIVTCELKTSLAVRFATLFYDLFYNVIYWATWSGSPYILALLGYDNGSAVLRLLPSEDAQSFQIGRELLTAIEAAGGTYAIKDLDDAVGLRLSFPERSGVDG